MRKIKQAKRFVKLTLSLVILTPLFYILSYHYIGIQDISISHSYKQFLLQHTKAQRLIIESGSNSGFAFDTYALEKEFKIQTINLADAASYPLKQKLLRLERYIKKDDIVILPLEWKYYSRENIANIFVNNLLGKLNFYYTFDTYKDELNQIQNTPFINYIQNIEKKSRYIRKQDRYLPNHLLRFDQNDRGSLKTDAKFNYKDKRTCDEYIFISQLKNGFKISSLFKENMKLIKRIQKKSKAVIFLWPTVAGDNCYRSIDKNKLDNFIVKIKDYLSQNNIKILGDPYLNKFTTKDILNTYYHINPSATKIRTQQMINILKNSQFSDIFTSNDKYSYIKNLKETKNHILSLLKPYNKKEIQAHKSSKLVFKDFQKPEKEFIWSKNKMSEISFKSYPQNIKGTLNLNINTLGKQNIKATINDTYIGEKTTNGKNKTLIFDFNPNILNKDKINTIKFEYSNPHRPNNKDKRILAMALKSLSIN